MLNFSSAFVSVIVLVLGIKRGEHLHSAAAAAESRLTFSILMLSGSMTIYDKTLQRKPVYIEDFLLLQSIKIQTRQKASLYNI